MGKLKPKQPWKPFYFGDPKWKKILLMPTSALKVWFCHYGHENQQDESWLSVETIMAETGLSENTVFTARRWLLDNGWITQKGFITSRHGHFPVPKFSVRRGIIPEKLVVGRTPKSVVPSHPKISAMDAPQRLGAEVTTLNQNLNYIQVEEEASASPANEQVKTITCTCGAINADDWSGLTAEQTLACHSCGQTLPKSKEVTA